MSFPFIVQKLFRNFLMIFAAIMILLTVMRQLYAPNEVFTLPAIYLILAVSLLSSLTGLITSLGNERSETAMRVKLIVHFIVLEVLLISLSAWLQIIQTVSDGILLAVQIAIVYVVIRFMWWKGEMKQADIINEKLRAMKREK